MACACDDGSIHLLDPTGLGEVDVLTSEQGGYYDVAWSPDGNRIAGGHFEPLVSLFDLSRRGPATTLDPNVFSDEGRTAVAFSPDGSILASTAYNAILRWSASGRRRKKLGVKAYTFFLDVAFAADASAFAAIAGTESRMTLHFWNADGSRKLGRVALPGVSSRLAWSADSRFVAVTERETPGLSLWSPQSLGRSEISVGGVDMAIAALAAHPAQRAFIAGSEHGQLVIWEEHGVRQS
jgi:WD40 repeat protein